MDVDPRARGSSYIEFVSSLRTAWILHRQHGGEHFSLCTKLHYVARYHGAISRLLCYGQDQSSAVYIAPYCAGGRLPSELVCLASVPSVAKSNTWSS